MNFSISWRFDLGQICTFNTFDLRQIKGTLLEKCDDGSIDLLDIEMKCGRGLGVQNCQIKPPKLKKG